MTSFRELIKKEMEKLNMNSNNNVSKTRLKTTMIVSNEIFQV